MAEKRNPIKRTLEILGGTAKDIGKDYTSNLQGLITDANMVKSTVIQGAQTTKEKFDSMKNGTGPIKGLLNWFYTKEGETSAWDLDDSDSEFDAGTTFVTDEEGNTKEEGPGALDIDSARDLTRGHINSMFKIAAKLTESQIATTAEITSTINSRSSEIIASVNNINTTLLGISKQLDTMSKVVAAGMGEQRRSKREDTLFDPTGRLTLGSVFDASQNAMKNSSLATYGSLFGTLKDSGFLTPELVMRLGYDFFLGDKKWKGLGDKSFNEVGQKFNDIIGQTVNDVMENIIDNGLFKKLVGDLKQESRSNDFGSFTRNEYTRDPALFDGMTRKSIVTVIPEYLKLIHQDLSGGQKISIDERGNLTSKEGNTWNKAVSKNLFRSGSMDYDDLTTFTDQIQSSNNPTYKNFKQYDINTVNKILTGAIVTTMQANNIKYFDKKWISPDNDQLINLCAAALEGTKGLSLDQWCAVVRDMMTYISSNKSTLNKFASDVNLRYEEIHNNLEKAASNVFDQQNVGEITTNAFLKAAATDLANRYKQQNAPVPPTNASISTVGSGDTDVTTGSITDALFDIRNLLAASVKKTVGNRNYNKIKLSSQSASATIDLDPTYYEEKDPRDEEERKEEEKKTKLTFQTLKSGEFGGGLEGVKAELSKTYDGIARVIKGSAGEVTAVVKNADGSETATSVFLDKAGKVAIDLGDKAKTATITGLNAAKNAASNVYNSNGVQNAIGWTKQTLEDTRDWTKEKFNDLKNMASDKMAKIADNRSYKAYEKLQEMSDQANNINKDNATEEEAEDANTVRMITTSMQLAIQNGSASQDEKGTIQRLINTIHDQKLKAKMRKNVNTILDRSSFEVKNEGESGKKGIFSKLFGFMGIITKPMRLLGTLLTFIVPKILRGGKNLLGKVFGNDIRDLKEKFGELKQERQNLRGLLRERRAERREERKERKNDPNRMTLMKAIQPATQQIQNAAKNVTDKAGNLINKGIEKGAAGIGTAIGAIKFNAGEFANGLKGGENAQFTTAGKIGSKVGTAINKTADAVGTGIGYVKGGLEVAKDFASDKMTAVKDKFKSKKNENGSIDMTEEGEEKPKSGFGQAADNLKQMAGDKLGGMKEKFGAFSEGFKIGLHGEEGEEGAEGLAKKNEITVDGIDEPAQTFTEKLLAKIYGLFTGKETDPEKNVFEKIAAGGGEEEEKKSDESENKEEGSSENGSINKDEGNQDQSQQQDQGSQKNENGSIAGTGGSSGGGSSESSSSSSGSSESSGGGGGESGGSSEGSSDSGGGSEGGGESSGGDSGGGGGESGGAGGALGKLTGGAGGGGKMLSTIMKIGKTVGKITKIMGGIWKIVAKIVLKAVMMLSGFKALKKTLESVLPALTKIISIGLKPLNKIFNMINKFLKPIIKTVKKILTSLMEGLSQILGTIIDTIVPILNNIITPVLNALMPVIDVILNVLQPLFDVVSAVIDIVFVPLGGIFKYVLTPVIKNIGNMMQVVMGILELGFGALMIPLGGILTAVGTIISILPFGSGGSGLKDSGKTMMSTGASMIKQGIKDIGSGIASYIQTVISAIKLEDQTEPENEDTYVENPNASEVRGIGSAFEGTSGSGDTSYTDSHDITNISNIYGAGNRSQKSYGNAMDMKDNGCGPAALADAHNRRHGTSYDGLDMAKSMAKSGAYEPGRGTSVGSFMKSSSALGDGLKAGGVTQASLKRATPTNPVTLVGSGSDFGTKKGNNHYVNVVGTDKYGGAYVSNPLTGRVDRRSASTLASSSVLGLYGSGDSEQFTFPDAVQEAMAELKSLAGGLLSMFSGKSAAEQMEDNMKKEGNKQSIENIKDQIAKLVATKDEEGGFEFPEDYDESVYGDDYFKYLQDKAEDAAFKDFEKDHPREDGETEDEYKKRFEKWYNEDRQFKYLSESEAFKELQDKIKEEGNKVTGSAKTFRSDLDKAQEMTATAADTIVSESAGSRKGVGGADAFADATAQVFEGLVANNPKVEYSHNPDQTVTMRDGRTISNVRPDCSGLIGAAITSMGYKLKGSTANSLLTYTFRDNKGDNSIIYNEDGTVSTDWQVLPFSVAEKKPGDVIVDSEAHMGMYMMSDGDGSGRNRGFDGGSTAGTGGTFDNPRGGIHKSAKVASSFLDKSGTLQSRYPSTPDAGVWTQPDLAIDDAGKPTHILRYVKPASGLLGDNDEESIWLYLTTHGVEKPAAAGFMGCWEQESDNDPNTLEGWYMWNGGKQSSEVQNALKDDAGMDDYTMNQLFPAYARYNATHPDKQISYVPDKYLVNGTHYAGLGLAQWTAGRAKAIADYAKERGRPFSDLESQLDFFNDEVTTGSYASVLKQANTMSDVNAATEYILANYEGVPGNALANRQAWAREFYERFKDLDPEVAKKTTTTPTGHAYSSTNFGYVNSQADADILNNMNTINTKDGKNTGTVMTATGVPLGLRKDKYDESDKLVWIPNGTTLELESSGTKGWYKTTYQGQTGYVNAQWVHLDRNEWADDYTATAEQIAKEKEEANARAAKEREDYEARISLPDGQAPGFTTPYVPKEPDSDMWEFRTWFTDGVSGNTRLKYYDELAKYHKMAMEGKDKNGSTPLGSKKTAINAYQLKYRNSKYKGEGSTVEETPDSSMYWKMLYLDTYNKHKDAALVDYSTYPVSQQIDALEKIYAKGDSSDDGTEVLGNALKGNVSDLGGIAKIMGVLTGNDTYDATASSEGIPPLDTDLTDTMEDSGGQTIVNKYSIMSNSKAQDARLNAILRNTYDVRDEQVAAILRKILRKLEENKKEDNPRTGGSSPNLFNDDRIPQAVQRLSKG